MYLMEILKQVILWWMEDHKQKLTYFGIITWEVISHLFIIDAYNRSGQIICNS